MCAEQMNQMAFVFGSGFDIITKAIQAKSQKELLALTQDTLKRDPLSPSSVVAPNFARDHHWCPDLRAFLRP